MIKFNHKNGILTLENELISYEFDINAGFISIMDKNKQQHVISKAFSSISYDSAEVNTFDKTEIKWENQDFEDEIGKGMGLILSFLPKAENTISTSSSNHAVRVR